MKKPIVIAIADDHELVRNGLSLIIESNPRCKVVIKAENGKVLLELLQQNESKVNLALIDISMPVMDGFETTKKLALLFPQIHVVALSVNNDFESVFKMIDAGAKAYLQKDCTEKNLNYTLQKVIDEGNHYDSFVIDKLKEYGKWTNIEVESNNYSDQLKILTSKEIQFLRMSCSEKTYKQIADEMEVSIRTIDGYRETLFRRLEVKSRIGLVLFAIESGIYMPAYKRT